MHWRILDSGKKSAVDLMRFDAQLLQDLEHYSEPTLHLYDWESPSATYGHFIQTDKFLNLTAVQKHNLALAKRPTGGGIIFHLWDFAFSLLLPSNKFTISANPLDNYQIINRHISQALQPLLKTYIINDQVELLKDCYQKTTSKEGSFCMAQPTCFDLMVAGKKLGGAAQRRTRFGLLHQGSISLVQPDFSYLMDLGCSDALLESMQKHTFYFDKATAKQTLHAEVSHLIKEYFTNVAIS